MCKAKVLAIIVTYNPEIIRLTECINSLAPQVERVILVDNGSNNSHLIKNIIINNLEIIYYRIHTCKYGNLSDKKKVYKQYLVGDLSLNFRCTGSIAI